MFETSRSVSASNQKSIDCSRKEGMVSAMTRQATPTTIPSKRANSPSVRSTLSANFDGWTARGIENSTGPSVTYDFLRGR